ncbi:LysR family transcriptional regulator [Gulosibacter sediminis]|uniref:LysR family transcriptional regulator n=1 Tax=Gulosibacter sediminis TaxID=1729695 RepID=UPI0024A7D123|nr:LysR family transcriptional regulator [Gulosibacter sediminis]
MLDLRQLSVLDAIARTGSLAAAARDLHYGQPTISHHLRALERHLDSELVVSSATGTALTAAGELMLEHARAVLTRLRVAERDVAELGQSGGPVLRMGTFESAGARLLPQVLAKLGTGRTVQVELVEGEPLGLQEQLLDGSLHCALLYDLDGDTSVTDAALRQRTLEREPFRIMLGADHPLATQEVIDLADLAEADWIRSRSVLEASERALLTAAGAAGFVPNTLLQSEDYSLVHGFVAAGVGVGLIVESAVDTRYRVVARPTVQDLGMRRVRFVATATPEPGRAAALARLEELLIEAAEVNPAASVE